MQRRLFFGLAISFVVFNISALDWPQWQGPDRDNVSKEVGLLKEWPKDGPKRVWLYENNGLGYGGPSILKGRLYITGARGPTEFLLGIDANSGKELGPLKSGQLKNNWGDGPRGTPATDGEHVYALGGQGTLICANSSDGKLMWKKTMQELGGEVPGWGYTESVYVDEKNVYCTPGGSKGALVALDKSNGNVVWQSKEFTAGAQYPSMVPAEIGGTKQLIQLTMNDIVGVDSKDGKVIWKSDFPQGRTAVIPTRFTMTGMFM